MSLFDWNFHFYIDESLDALGLAFNPFQYLEASKDPYLPEYLVTEDLPSAVWDNSAVSIYAPVGSGKTALRIFSTLTCWKKLGSPHPLPVTVTPGSESFLLITSKQEYFEFLFRTIIKSLFIGLIHRPERFLYLHRSEQRQLVAWFEHFLPASLPYYLKMLHQQGTPMNVAHILDRSYRVQSIPPKESVQYFCQTLQSILVGNDFIHRDIFVRQETFKHLLFLVRKLQFNAIYFLVDGVDAFYEVVRTPSLILPWLQNLESWISDVGTDYLFPKYFLPLEMETELHAFSMLSPLTVHLQWTSARLIQLIRKRLIIASGGKVESFDVISSPSISNIEDTLVQFVQPIPREVLVFCELLLVEYARQGFILLEEQHLVKAYAHYQSVTPFLYNL